MATFTVVSVTNPIYTNQDQTGIDAMVQFAELSNPVPFHATSYDTEAHGIQLYNDLKSGKYGEVAPYVFDPVAVAAQIRLQRNNLITASDWTQGSDVPAETKAKWTTYRQALRDVPQQSTFPNSVVWPTPPV